MTVSHTKGRPSNAAYYLREVALRDEGMVGGKLPGEKGIPLAEWFICGPTDELTCATLKLERRPWESIADVRSFQNLSKGFVNQSGVGDVPLVQNAGSPKRVALHDFTLSAPKSVSVIWALTDVSTRQMIEQAQRLAAHAFVQLLGNEAAYSRQGRGGRIKTPCSLVAALFPHFISRSGDPQLHTHCVFLNVAVRPDESTGCLETLGIMCQLGIAATRYHEVLADGMRGIGFSVRQTGRLFEIDGVPAEVCRAFSQRRVAALAQAKVGQVFLGGSANQYPPSRKRMQAAVLKTRPQRRVRPIRLLRERWMVRASELQFELADRFGMNGGQQSVPLTTQSWRSPSVIGSDEVTIPSEPVPAARPFPRCFE